jgi:hypothetical protein
LRSVVAAVLELAPGFSLPLDAVTETFALIAKRRVGKSNVAVVTAEQMYDAGIPWCAIDPKGDWYGVRSSADGSEPGLSVAVFGGAHGDRPLPPDAGGYMADLVAHERLTCVLDVSGMTKGEQIRFLYDFATRLLAVNTEPVHLFFEECDDYIPQSVMKISEPGARQLTEIQVVRAFSKLVRHGGFKGIGCTLITQRVALVNKNVLSQVETFFLLRTIEPLDVTEVAKRVKGHAQAKEIVDSMPSLPVGAGWVYSPAFLERVELIERFHRRRTFDSGRTPKMGEKRLEPKRLADVDLDAITAAMEQYIVEAKANDPAELRRRIAELERQIERGDTAPAPPPAPAPEPVRVPYVPAKVLDGIEGLGGEVDSASHELEQVAKSIYAFAQGLRDMKLDVVPAVDSLAIARESPAPAPHPSPVVAVREPRPAASDDQRVAFRALREGARRMVDVLVNQHPGRLTKRQIASLARVKITGGTWSTYWSEINRSGYVEEVEAGLYRASALALAVSDVEPATPSSTADVLAVWRPRLREGARRMLDIVVEAYPAWVPRPALAKQAEIEVSGGTFSTYLSDLRRNFLVDVDRKRGVRAAAETLMLEAR